MAKRVKELVPNSLVTADVLENIETGRTRLKLSDALDIAIALGVPLVNLFVDVQKPFENNPLFPDGKTNLQIYDEQRVVPEFLRTLVFARPRGDDQFADCTFSPSLDMSR